MLCIRYFKALFYVSTLCVNICLQIQTVVFDKTGTITYGAPKVVQMRMVVEGNKMPRSRLLAIVGTAENHSEHPLGAAITRYCKQVGIDGQTDTALPFGFVRAPRLVSLGQT